MVLIDTYHGDPSEKSIGEHDERPGITERFLQAVGVIAVLAVFMIGVDTVVGSNVTVTALETVAGGIVDVAQDTNRYLFDKINS